jgi:hypothetical protein
MTPRRPARPSPARRPARRSHAPRGRGRGVLLVAAAAALLWLSRGWWWPQPPPPQLILVLGGDVDRERRAAELSRQRGLPVVVSGGSNPEYAHWLFEQSGVRGGRVRLDYRAHDTLSNFTSVVADLRRARVRHVLLVTSSDHMQRALLVGRIVAGSRGITLTPVAVPCGERCAPELRRKVWGDGARALLWVITGRDLRGWAAERFAPWMERAGARRSAPTGSDPDRAGH